MTGTDTAKPEPTLADEMPLGEALEYAVRHHRKGDVDTAEKVYRHILEALPHQPDALNFLGMIAMHRGRLNEAIDLIRRSLAIDPTHGERYNNLGNVLLAAERTSEAVAAYEQALELAPGSAAAYNNLGIIYRAQGRADAAAEAYERAIEIDPSRLESWNNYGNLLAARGDVAGAMRHYAKALTIRPHDRSTKQYIALAYVTVGQLENAVAIYREWLKEEPDHPGIRHLIAALSGTDVPPRASDAYIEFSFDRFAESFDAHLAHLEYRAPQLVAAAVRKAEVTAAERFSVLDAGCGTGLCGPLLKGYAAKLVGVDLSAGMLEKARNRDVYDELVKAELTQFLRSRPDEYDLIVSADTLVYFGELGDAAYAAAAALRAGGLLIFTVEKADDAEAPEGHRINPHGRYSHTRTYVQRTLTAAGFSDITIEDDILRQETGLPVKGLVVTARRAPANAAE